VNVSPDATTTGPHGALRESLEAERQSLRARLGELGIGSEALSYDSNFADSSQVTAERGEAEALAANLMEALAQVERALAKFDDATYGKCEACGGEIAYARLEAKPEARYCISCAASRR
jgi:DnaK suppressor protein